MVAPHLKKIEIAAIEAAHAAGAVLSYYYGRHLHIREKKGAGVVTQADIEAERAALKILTTACPDFDVIAEESAPSPKKLHSKGRWLIDPLDGTTNYVHGFPMFCVSIGAEIAGNLAVGVIYHPILNDLYVATKGKGAFLNGKKISVSKTRQLKNALLTTGFTYRKNQILKAEMVAFERMSRVAQAIRRPGSAALDLAYTARGIFDGFWERRLAPWDTAAGALLVSEAGGKVTDFAGNRFKPEFTEILASNRLIHPSLLKEVQARRV